MDRMWIKCVAIIIVAVVVVCSGFSSVTASAGRRVDPDRAGAVEAAATMVASESTQIGLLYSSILYGLVHNVVAVVNGSDQIPAASNEKLCAHDMRILYEAINSHQVWAIKGIIRSYMDLK